MVELLTLGVKMVFLMHMVRWACSNPDPNPTPKPNPNPKPKPNPNPDPTPDPDPDPNPYPGRLLLELARHPAAA